MLVALARLKEVLHYDPLTGIFVWEQSRGTRKAGAVAGSTCRPDGYVYIKIDRRLYKAHRLAWFYVHGKWPKSDGRQNQGLDHKEGRCNRIDNLREATHGQNMANRRLQSNNKTGLKCVFRRESGRFRSYISKEGKRYHLGTFDTAEEAHAAYVAKAVELHGEFARAA